MHNMGMGDCPMLVMHQQCLIDAGHGCYLQPVLTCVRTDASRSGQYQRSWCYADRHIAALMNDLYWSVAAMQHLA